MMNPDASCAICGELLWICSSHGAHGNGEPPRPLWHKGPLAGFDTETDGLDPEDTRIVTAAIVLDRPGSDPEVRTWLLNTGREIPSSAVSVHGISTAQVIARGMPEREGLAGIRDTLASVRDRGLPLVMTNAVYDLTILDRGLRRHGLAPLGQLPPILDTLVLDRWTDRYRRGRRTLTATMAVYGLTIKGAHTAEGDAAGAIQLLRAIADKYWEVGGASPAQLQEIQREKHADQVRDLVEYRRRSGQDVPDQPEDWPVIPAAPEDWPATRAEPEADGHRPLTAGPAASEDARPEKASATAAAAAAEMPAQQGDGLTFPARLSLPLSDDQARLLRAARVEDGIATSFRVRAMLGLWAEDAQFRAQIDAQALRDRRLNRDQARRSRLAGDFAGEHGVTVTPRSR